MAPTPPVAPVAMTVVRFPEVLEETRENSRFELRYSMPMV